MSKLSYMYNNKRWRSLRASHLADHPLCAYCYARGIVIPATVVDHIVPHRGDHALMWDADNLQSLCASCHSSTKQIEEGAPRGCTDDGDVPWEW